jgi:hypothetical protein
MEKFRETKNFPENFRKKENFRKPFSQKYENENFRFNSKLTSKSALQSRINLMLLRLWEKMLRRLRRLWLWLLRLRLRLLSYYTPNQLL